MKTGRERYDEEEGDEARATPVRSALEAGETALAGVVAVVNGTSPRRGAPRLEPVDGDQEEE